MLRKERDAISVEDDSDTTASFSRDLDNISVEDDSDTTVSFSQDVGGSSGVEEVETSYMEERSLVHGEEQQKAKVAVVVNVPGKVDEEAVEEQADRGEDHEQDTVEKQLESMPGEGTPPSSTVEKEMEEGSTSNISNRFL